MKEISLSTGKSVWLDFIRCASALLVLVGHIEMVFSQTVGSAFIQKSIFRYLFFQSHQAVMVFFVLSGYLITYTVLKKKNYSFKEYFLDRWSRIYSVLIPVVFLTLLLDLVGGMFSASYGNHAVFPQDGFMVRFLANILSLQGFGGYRIQLGSNPALWSIGYEFWFYIIFGILIFGVPERICRFSFIPPKLLNKTGTAILQSFIKFILIMMIFLIFGLKFFGYFCIWTLGALSCYLFHVKNFQRGSLWFIFSFAGFFLINHFFIYDRKFSVGEFAGDFLLALALAFVFVSRMDQFFSFLTHVSKFLSRFSYTIYAVHLPIMYFILLVIIPRQSALIYPFAVALFLFAATLVFAYAFYLVTENKRFFFREKLSNLFLFLYNFNKK